MERNSHEDQIKEEEPILISPPSGAESLFLAGLNNSAVKTKALSQQLGHRYTQQHQQNPAAGGRIKKSGSFQSALTRGSGNSIDDFISCVENDSDLYSIDSNENNNNNYNSPLAARSSRFSMKTIDDNISNNNMAKKSKTNTKKQPIVLDDKAADMDKKPPLPDVAPAPTTAPTTPSPTGSDDEPMKVDAAEVVYGKAKDIYAWGKTVPVVSFFVGIPEAVAGKALEVVGTDLSQIDGKIESELGKFDSGILNPAIEAIAKVLIGVAGKSEEIVKPIIDTIIKTLGMLPMIKSELNEQSPEAHTETPEVTAIN